MSRLTSTGPMTVSCNGILLCECESVEVERPAEDGVFLTPDGQYAIVVQGNFHMTKANRRAMRRIQNDRLET